MQAEAAAGLPKVSADGKTYTITIKQGFKFSNGATVTAANFRARSTGRTNQKHAVARRLVPRRRGARPDDRLAHAAGHAEACRRRTSSPG